jgi:hypothetical protein
VFCAHHGGTTGSAACCAEWLRLSEPIAPTLVFDHEAAPPPAVLSPHRRRSLSKKEDEFGMRPERRSHSAQRRGGAGEALDLGIDNELIAPILEGSNGATPPGSEPNFPDFFSIG